jgi:hypothetical protein
LTGPGTARHASGRGRRGAAPADAIIGASLFVHDQMTGRPSRKGDERGTPGRPPSQVRRGFPAKSRAAMLLACKTVPEPKAVLQASRVFPAEIRATMLLVRKTMPDPKAVLPSSRVFPAKSRATMLLVCKTAPESTAVLQSSRVFKALRCVEWAVAGGRGGGIEAGRGDSAGVAVAAQRSVMRCSRELLVTRFSTIPAASCQSAEAIRRFGSWPDVFKRLRAFSVR